MKAFSMAVVGIMLAHGAACDSGAHVDTIDAPAADALARDAAVDAFDGDARTCGVSPAVPAQPTTGGPVEGSYALVWTCERGCSLNRPGLTYARQLVVFAASLAYSSATCAECTLTHTGGPSVPGCVDVAPGADWGQQCRHAYRLCEVNGRLEGRVSWLEPGLSVQEWRLFATRL